MDTFNIIRFTKLLIPHLDELLVSIEKNAGWLDFNNEFIKVLITCDFKWREYYENEKLLKAIGMLMFFDVDELKDIHKKKLMDKVVEDFSDTLNIEKDISFPTEEEQERWAEEFKNATEDEKKETLKELATLYIGFLCTLFNYLALMVHGRTMCQLVADAKNGDDQAFCLAVQIDRTVLNLPYFQQRLLRSQFTNDQKFLDTLSYRLKTPVLQSKIKYRTLMLAFAILDDEGYLDLPHEQLFDICEEIGVYGKDHGIEDVGHLSKRLKDYRKHQRNSKIF